MDKTTNIGAALKRYLVDHGIKQTYLAKVSGLSDSTISDLCTGLRYDQNIPAIVIFKICRGLDIPVSTFINDEMLEVK